MSGAPASEVAPSLTWKPLVSMPCWRKGGDYLTKQNGKVWLVFGVIPVWHTWDKPK